MISKTFTHVVQGAQGWLRELRGPQKIQLELEAIAGNKHDLDAIVAKSSSWRFTLGDGNVLVVDESGIAQSFWTGSKFYSGHPSQGFAVIRSEPGFSHKKRDEKTDLALEDSATYYMYF